MAQKGVQLDQEKISCPICLDLLKDPVTVPCGHSYCAGCIQIHWDEQNEQNAYSCPQCRQTFSPRPVLGKNTMLADLVDDLQKSRLEAAQASNAYAGPDDVACDVCTGTKRKASKSCLQCLASYCEKDLQFHHESPALKKHKLVEPSKKLQENICSTHDELMKIFCRTDQQPICYLCLMEEHKDHKTVPAATERAERQKKIEDNQQIIQKRIDKREYNMKMLDQELGIIHGSGDNAIEQSEQIVAELILLLQSRYSDLNEQVRSKHKTEVHRVIALRENLAKEIIELKTKETELQELIHTEDHIQFLRDYPSLSQLRESTDSSSIHIHPLEYYEEVIADMIKLRDKLQDVLTERPTNIQQTEAGVDRILSQPEPKTRDQFLQYAIDLTVDPDTANGLFALSHGGKRVRYVGEIQSYLGDPERFHSFLSKETLTGRCYWEMKWRGRGLCVAVAYNESSRERSLSDPSFGLDDTSWALSCFDQCYDLGHNGIVTPLRGPWSTRVGVYLDHSAGVLAFYSISGTPTLLRRIQTTFTQPLCAGLMLPVGFYETTAEFCQLK
ncbi:tripartite motif-containing protein 16-like [Cheilinus undulatus]|uniref:tripartite motif-containing protein 16-like n=1 Tax=Cheilinus undulatus TaxID=241271 RepID=UPI001BD5AB05|nr:tripartite motif-containing protein 16-like [Cheilinus undulatus]